MKEKEIEEYACHGQVVVKMIFGVGEALRTQKHIVRDRYATAMYAKIHSAPSFDHSKR